MNEPNRFEQSAPFADHHSYLLRLWRTNRLGNSGWHASLENPRTGERFGFADLEQLFAYLMALIERDNKRGSDQSKMK